MPSTTATLVKHDRRQVSDTRLHHANQTHKHLLHNVISHLENVHGVELQYYYGGDEKAKRKGYGERSRTWLVANGYNPDLDEFFTGVHDGLEGRSEGTTDGEGALTRKRAVGRPREHSSDERTGHIERAGHSSRHRQLQHHTRTSDGAKPETKIAPVTAVLRYEINNGNGDGLEMADRLKYILCMGGSPYRDVDDGYSDVDDLMAHLCTHHGHFSFDMQQEKLNGWQAGGGKTLVHITLRLTELPTAEHDPPADHNERRIAVDDNTLNASSSMAGTVRRSLSPISSPTANSPPAISPPLATSPPATLPPATSPSSSSPQRSGVGILPERRTAMPEQHRIAGHQTRQALQYDYMKGTTGRIETVNHMRCVLCVGSPRKGHRSLGNLLAHYRLNHSEYHFELLESARAYGARDEQMRIVVTVAEEGDGL